jgi:hypothetical protein
MSSASCASGAVVQRSTDGGRRWTSILTPSVRGRLRGGHCYPAPYRSVTALQVSALLPGTLFVATAGRAERLLRTRHDGACQAATGGLFVLRPDGHGGLRRTASLVAGLPYTQDADGRTPRAYTLLSLVPDPTNPAVLYSDATLALGAPAGPDSPPAGLYRSTNGGLSWSPALAGRPRASPARSAPRGTLILTVDPAKGAIVFAVLGTTLYRSVDHGGEWTAVRGLPTGRTLRLFVNPANPQLVYVLSAGGLYHSRDAGATWTRVTDRRLPAAGRIRALTFDVGAPSAVTVRPVQGPALRLVEPHAPAPPWFAPALALTPQRDDRVMLAVHAAPLAQVRLTVVGGAPPMSARLITDAGGVGYASVRLRGHVEPAALRVELSDSSTLRTLQEIFGLRPWLGDAANATDLRDLFSTFP